MKRKSKHSDKQKILRETTKEKHQAVIQDFWKLVRNGVNEDTARYRVARRYHLAVSTVKNILSS